MHVFVCIFMYRDAITNYGCHSIKKDNNYFRNFYCISDIISHNTDFFPDNSENLPNREIQSHNYPFFVVEQNSIQYTLLSPIGTCVLDLRDVNSELFRESSFNSEVIFCSYGLFSFVAIWTFFKF